MRNTLLSVSLIILLSGVFGCSEPLPDGMPKLYRVTLEFHQENTPLAGASVRLVPQFESQWQVGGSTNAKGQIPLKTYGKYDGVPAGKYKICISKFESEGELPQIGKATVPMKHFNLVETQYTTQKTTPLEIEVVEGKNKFQPFDLGKAVRLEVAAPGQ